LELLDRGQGTDCPILQICSTQLTLNTGPLASLVPLAEYGEARHQVFPSASSMAWFVRQHKSELVERGAILMIAGRWFVEPSVFDAYIVEHGKTAARAALIRAPRLARGSYPA
jgi:hypothetical protein